MNTHLLNDTYTQQSRFANYCRTGELEPLKGLTENRVHHYRRLVYNVVDDTLQSAFPLTHDLLSSEEWDSTVDKFFSSHSCQSYSIWKMPFEFYQFIEKNNVPLKEKYPFIEELLLFEWIEIEVYMMEDKVFPEAKNAGDWRNDVIAINPEFRLLQLSYPVHLKNPNEILEEERGEYYLLVFRERETGKVQFMNLSFYFAWLIEKISDEQKPLNEILNDAEAIFGLNTQTLLENTLPLLEELKNKQFILGFKK